MARLALPQADDAAPQRHVEAAAPTDGDAVELCGLSRIARKGLEDPEASRAALSAPVKDAVRRTVERLRAAPDDRGRAAADLLVWSLEQEAGAVSNAERIEREGIDCTKEFERCTLGVGSAAQWEALDRLVRRAVISNDPWVYGLAHRFCSRPHVAEQVRPCQLISTARWAQLEPDNAVPWLVAAAQAQQANDPAGVDESLHRAAQARRNDVRFAESVRQVRAGMPADVAPFIGLGVDGALIGVEAAFVMPYYPVVSRHCTPKGLAEPSRSAVCEDLVRLQLERSTTLLDLNMGISLAKRLGWPAQRLAPHEELRDAVMGQQAEAVAAEIGSPSPYGCASVIAQRERLVQVAAQGEIVAHAAWADASPLGRAGMAAKHRAEAASAAADRNVQNP